MKSRIDQHQVIAGGGGSPTLAKAAYLTAPDGVSLLETLDIAWSAHAHLRVVINILLGRYHPSTHIMDAFVKSLMYQ